MNPRTEGAEWKEAEDIFSKVFFNVTGTAVDIRTFRQVVALGKPNATDQLTKSNRRWAERFLADPDNDRFFLDKAGFIEITGGVEAMEKALTWKQLDTVTRSVAAASIVFMHSAFDSAAYDLCRVCALVAPPDWDTFISEQKVTLGAVKGSNYATLLRQQLDKHLATLERQSLLAKIDRLFELCHPEAGSTPVKGYVYDRQRVKAIDEERHRIVHGDANSPAGIPEKVDFLQDTGLYLLGIVNARYGVKVNPEFAWNR